MLGAHNSILSGGYVYFVTLSEGRATSEGGLVHYSGVNRLKNLSWVQVILAVCSGLLTVILRVRLFVVWH